MELIYLYGLFALTTAICAHYELVSPVLKELAALSPGDTLVQNKALTHVTMFCLSLLFAPVIILPSLIPSAGNYFRESLLTSLVG